MIFSLKTFFPLNKLEKSLINSSNKLKRRLIMALFTFLAIIALFIMGESENEGEDY
ncbi:hypothetical protein LCGC14_1751990 [marine sediment metagenome]|uniref:Uncharacterized protein n=1 Tax=marine sediment metagenome TaxID=412755 RepID=A0A0F9JIP4_9ZZZZ